MNEQDREAVQNAIEEQRRELQKKREVLERLKQQLGTEAPTSAPSDAESLYKAFLDQAQELAKARAEAAKLTVVPPPSRATAAGTTPTENQAEIKIVAAEPLKLDKVVQTDAEPERPPPSVSAIPAVPGSHIDEDEVKTSPPSVPVVVTPPSDLVPKEVEDKGTQEINEDQKAQIMSSQDFCEFVDKTTLTMEKILNQDRIVNLFEDYSGKATTSVESEQVDKLGEFVIFEDAKHAARRTVQCLQASPKYGHLFLAAYGRRRDSSTDAEGTCLIWSLENQTRPQAVFTATSAVTCACFDPVNEAVIYGGTSGGSLLLWDMRAGARPVQKTKLALQSHKQPALTHQTYVRNVFVVGSQHNRTLLSIDEENRCCTWSVSMVLTHQGTTDLKWKGTESGFALKSTSADTRFSTTSVCSRGTRILGGTQDGCLWDAAYTGSEVQMTTYCGKAPDLDFEFWHRGPITGLDAQPNVGDRGDDLILTSSTDWSVRLWDLNTAPTPLHSFDSSTEAVFDVKWAPAHPAVFASGDGGANLCIWNLNRSWYQPRVQIQVEAPAAISRVEWIMGGKRVLAGTSTGRIHCAGVGPELSQLRGHLSHFEATLEDAKIRSQQRTNT